MLIIFFNSQGVVHKEFMPEVKIVNAEFYEGVMDGPLKCIQQVCPAAFRSQDSSLLHDNVPAHKAVFPNFLTKKVLQSFITPATLQMYHHQTMFCSPS